MHVCIATLIFLSFTFFLQIINGYLALLTTNDPNIFVVNSYVVTAIITKKTMEMSKNLFSKVHIKV